jgi:hypothetical protein
MNIAHLQHTKPFMPPFAGTAQELESLVQFLNWTTAGSPADWPAAADSQRIERIQAWLDESGVEPGANKMVHPKS